jgi:ribosomal protein S18 acetylase RimI-like enzyme
VIREATKHDVRAVRLLYSYVQEHHSIGLPQLFKKPTPDADPGWSISDYLRHRGSFIALYFDEEEAVGYVAARRVDRREDTVRFAQSTLYIDQIGIAPAFRRHGYGRALIDYVKARAAAAGNVTVSLDVWSFNDRARAFFQSCGFTPYREQMWLKP